MNFAHAASPAAADDATLVARYVAGDDQAFAALLTRHQARVFTTIYLVVRDRMQAEDLTQDTFMKAIRTMREGLYVEAGRFGGWLASIAHNTAIDALRRRKLTVSLDAPVDSTLSAAAMHAQRQVNISHSAPSPETLAIREESHAHLRGLIQDLPIAQRQVLVMRHYGQLTFQEIATELGVSVNTVTARMRYALQKLRQKMTVTGTSAVLLAAFVTSSLPLPFPQANDPSFYPGNADPVRLQRTAG